MQTKNDDAMKIENGVHILDSIFAVAFEMLAPDYLDRYQPADLRPVDGEPVESLDVTQVLQAVQS